MALGFKMGVSGEKPRTETFNVTENGTFDMGEKNLYRYVNANISDYIAILKMPNSTSTVTLSYGFTMPSTIKPLVLITNQQREYPSYLTSVTQSRCTVKTRDMADYTTVAIIVGLKNVKNYNFKTGEGSSTGYHKIDLDFLISDMSKVFVNVVSSNGNFYVTQGTTTSSVSIYLLAPSYTYSVQVFEFE